MLRLLLFKSLFKGFFPLRGCGGPEKDRDLVLVGWWQYLYEVISVLPQLSEVPLVWLELLFPDELLVLEEVVVLVVDSDVPSSIRVVWSFRGGPRWGPHSCAM